jgi:hypothetical protein
MILFGYDNKRDVVYLYDAISIKWSIAYKEAPHDCELLLRFPSSSASLKSLDECVGVMILGPRILGQQRYVNHPDRNLIPERFDMALLDWYKAGDFSEKFIPPNS